MGKVSYSVILRKNFGGQKNKCWLKKIKKKIIPGTCKKTIQKFNFRVWKKKLFSLLENICSIFNAYFFDSAKFLGFKLELSLEYIIYWICEEIYKILIKVASLKKSF